MQSSGRDKVIRTHLTDMIGKVTGGHCEPLGVELPQMYTHKHTRTLTDLKNKFNLLFIPVTNGGNICMKHHRDVKQPSQTSKDAAYYFQLVSYRF